MLSTGVHQELSMSSDNIYSLRCSFPCRICDLLLFSDYNVCSASAVMKHVIKSGNLNLCFQVRLTHFWLRINSLNSFKMEATFFPWGEKKTLNVTQPHFKQLILDGIITTGSVYWMFSSFLSSFVFKLLILLPPAAFIHWVTLQGLWSPVVYIPVKETGSDSSVLGLRLGTACFESLRKASDHLARRAEFR